MEFGSEDNRDWVEWDVKEQSIFLCWSAHADRPMDGRPIRWV